MTSIRSVRAAEGRFVQISNEAAQDPRLSLMARGIILFVLSLPSDKRFTAQWLAENVPDGRRVVNKALAELKTSGYLRVTKRSLGRGRWEWEQIISDAPVPDGDKSGKTAFPQVSSSDQNRSDELTCTDTPYGEFPQVSSSDQNRSDELTCTDTPSSQVISSDRFSSDDNRSDKRFNTSTPNTEDEEHGRRDKSPAIAAVVPLHATLLGNALLDEHVAACRHRPPRDVLRRTGEKIDLLLDDGFDADLIRRSLALMRARGKGPGLLPDLLNEILNPGPLPAGAHEPYSDSPSTSRFHQPL